MGNALVLYNDLSAGLLRLAVEISGSFTHYELLDRTAGGDGPILAIDGETLHALAWDRSAEELLHLRGSLVLTSAGGTAWAGAGLRIVPSLVRGGEAVRLGAGGGNVRLEVVDATGRLVARLGCVGPVLEWRAADTGGRPLAPGAYYWRAWSGSGKTRGRVLVVR
jgi:hypothetical protein